MPEYKRVRHELTGHEYDRVATKPLRDGEVEIDRPRVAGRWMPPKHRTNLAGKPTPPRAPKSPAPSGDGSKAEQADTNKE